MNDKRAEIQETPSQLIERAKAGERIPRQRYSLHDSVIDPNCTHGHGWRTIVCNSEDDVVECPDCGAQRVEKCNFDEDFA